MNKPLLLLWLLTGLFIGVAADEESQPLVEYVWVKGKLSQMAKDSQGVITITAEEIRSLPVRDLVDLFTHLPGVHLSRKGPLGAAFDLSFRGGNFEQTLIMIDGIPWNNPQTGHFNANLPLALEEVDSIQLIRGGNGARYGSAFAGVINIVTRQRPGLSGSLSAGQFGLFGASLKGGFSPGKGVKLQGTVRSDRSDGFHPGREIDSLLYSASLSWETASMIFGADMAQAAKNFGAAGFYAPLPSREESDAGRFNIHWHLKGKGAVPILKLYISRQTHEDRFELDRTRPEFFRNHSKTERLLLNAESAFSLAFMELRLGAELLSDRMESQVMGNPREDSASLTLHGSWNRGGLTVDWGLRGEWWQNLRPELVSYAGISYRPDPHWLIKASLGRSNRKPSFTERFYSSPANRGDVHLQREIGENYELSLLSPRRFGVFELSLFYRRQIATIDWVDTDPTSGQFWQAVNLDPYSVAGMEFSYAVELGGIRLNLGLERLWSRGAPGVGYASKYGFRIPDLVLRGSGLSALSRALSLSWNYSYKRLLASRESAHLMDLQLLIRLNDSFSLYLLAQNIGNELLEEIAGVPIAGRWFSAGFRFRL